MKNLKKIIAVLVLAASVSFALNSNDTINQSAVGNKVEMNQKGKKLSANVDQSGSYNTATFNQSGSLFKGTIKQSGDTNNADISQYHVVTPSTSCIAYIEQVKNNNSATIQQGSAAYYSRDSILQPGSNNLGSILSESNGANVILQDGKSNFADVTNKTEYGSTNVYQKGNENAAQTKSSGTIKNDAAINQIGDKNKSTITQLSDGTTNFAKIDQIGNGNGSMYGVTEISQEMGQNNATIRELGIFNTGIIRQKGNGTLPYSNDATLLQNGDFNNALLLQDTGANASVSQIGNLNVISSTQQGKNTVIASQVGSNNKSDIVATGSNASFQRVTLEQKGDKNVGKQTQVVDSVRGELSLRQIGSFNGAEQSQTGSKNYASIQQNGDNNQAFQTQKGVALYASITQDFDGNATQYQEGSHDTATIIQEGVVTSSKATQQQYKNNNSAYIYQKGVSHEASQMQNGTYNSAYINQQGFSNTAKQTQLSDFDNSVINQKGSFNTAIVTQQ